MAGLLRPISTLPSPRSSDRARALPEMHALEEILAAAPPALRHEVVDVIEHRGERLGLHLLELGTADPGAPAIGFFGGVHGIERIGSQVLVAFLRSLVERLAWDARLVDDLEHVRLVFMPIVNPAGMWDHTRSNPRGVDLMRNAPIDAEGKTSFLVSGQRYSPRLPWYRGVPGDDMEREARALCAVVRERLLPHRFALTIDCHSGFGQRDRLWFPYAHSLEPFPLAGEMLALKELFDRTYPHHTQYVFEPTAAAYTIQGDLWDFLFEEHRQGGRESVFVPLTLEMGSWTWVRKNLRQLLRFGGLFNPMLPHRQDRILRRHLVLLDFLVGATRSHQAWLPADDGVRDQLDRRARALWYKEPAS